MSEDNDTENDLNAGRAAAQQTATAINIENIQHLVVKFMNDVNIVNKEFGSTKARFELEMNQLGAKYTQLNTNINSFITNLQSMITQPLATALNSTTASSLPVDFKPVVPQLNPNLSNSTEASSTAGLSLVEEIQPQVQDTVVSTATAQLDAVEKTPAPLDETNADFQDTAVGTATAQLNAVEKTPAPLDETNTDFHLELGDDSMIQSSNKTFYSFMVLNLYSGGHLTLNRYIFFVNLSR
jgi:hypothetical protein